MGKKVTCNVCLYQTDSFCDLKKCKVKLKKKRVCDKFERDNNKITFKQPIPTTRRPDWYWDREERRRLLKEALNDAQRQTVEQARRETEMVNPRDTKHPLTGDLSRFKTTAGKDDKEKENE